MPTVEALFGYPLQREVRTAGHGMKIAKLECLMGKTLTTLTAVADHVKFMYFRGVVSSNYEPRICLSIFLI